MPDKKRDAANGGYFTSEGCDYLEINEEDTQPGAGLSEKDRERLRKKYGGKMPPPSDPADDLLIFSDEELTREPPSNGPE